MIKINKREWQEKINQENEELVAFNPELAQGFYDNEGNKLPKEKMEQFIYIPMGFIKAGILSKLTESDVKMYLLLASVCNPNRNTQITNTEIKRKSKDVREKPLSNVTIKRTLAKLRWYHLIRARSYFVRPKRKRRVITLLRWDTAYPELCRENKIKAINKNDVVFVSDYKPKEELK